MHGAMRGGGISGKLGQLAVAVLLLAGTGWASLALFIVLQRRVPLHAVLGPTFWLLSFGLVLAVFCGSRRLLRELASIRHELAALGRGEPHPSEASSRRSPFAPFRGLLVVVVLSWLAILAFVQPVERLWVLVGVGIAFGVWSLGLELQGPLARLPGSVRRSVDLFLFVSCAAVLLLELCLRAIGTVHPSPLLARFGDLPETVLESLRMAPGQTHMGFPCNRDGHFDDEFRRKAPGERLVVTIGDSFSLGVVPHELHFTTVCERELGLPVDNLGIPASGPPEYLRMLVDEALPLDPDLVVIDVFVGNDLASSALVQGQESWLGDWLQRESVLIYLVPRRLAKMAEERRLVEHGGPVAEVQGAAETRAGSIEELFPWVRDPSLERPTLSEKSFLLGEVGRANSMDRLRPDDLEAFFDAMLLMKRSAGSVPICAMLIPDEFQVEDAVWEALLAEPPDVELARDHAQELLVPWFERNGIPCLDLLPVFRAVPPMEDGRKHLYHVRDTHFNARGNRVAGEALAKFLRPQLPPAISR